MSLSQISFSSTPRLLWDIYVKYLWNYQPGSWVGRTASAFRILAVILVLPVVVLTLLDVTSYVIARTLGVVDDVKASTSDSTNETIPIPVPSAFIQDTSLARASADLAPEENHQTQSAACHQGHNTAADLEDLQASDDSIRPQAFFAGEEDLQLSGVGVFSPAASTPPSPLFSRMKLHTFDSGVVRVGEVNDDEGIVLRRRPQEGRSSNA
ncbi:hypothetical protein BS17DRAFT_783330 [Gyrodon lividus]|nr:hypothetical protein BS17DRAFT_783330 [Gyrodon lividus]